MSFLKSRTAVGVICIVLSMEICFGITPALAAGTGDVAGAIEGTGHDASDQIKTVISKVVFPAIDLILAVFFFAKLGMAYFDYRKHVSSNGPRLRFCSPASCSR